ncbi:Lrp/AsnC family transcriptional regulator [Microlunatus soli]|uniref:DNA-binding transcriptional regulator, Lrp family n=1 Tax=Microlunatus soli TaxID=630515 RepID=A0A1H1QZL1_9ACTN|nr:Lrp/AsnC family transcriptional regulator [Microlunatus soli]SDS28715.1 DNA-binding transcriptional regulator, Lrp family [Microlunatus soli]
MSGPMVLDETDERILTVLTRNARATFNEIGSVVGLSAPAVKRRVDRLVASKAIRGFTTVVDPAAMGWTTEAYVSVFCTGVVAPEVLARAWEDIPEIVSAATVTGAADAVLRVVASDVGHLERAIERIRRSGSVDHSDSVIVLSRLIERTGNGREPVEPQDS